MSDLARPPAWARVDGRAIADAHRIAYAHATRTPVDPRAVGVACALNWATGGEPAPISHRRAVDVDVAQTEWRIAGELEHGLTTPAPGTRGIPRVVTDGRFAAGVGAALGWLLGHHDRPPVDIPTRLDDGTLPTADQLYRRYVDERPHTMWTPERRAALRRWAQQRVDTNRKLAELADSVG